MSNIPASDLHVDNLPSSSNLPPTKDGQRKPTTFGGSSSITQQQAIRNQIV
jgi:hypothetical protein